MVVEAVALDAVLRLGDLGAHFLDKHLVAQPLGGAYVLQRSGQGDAQPVLAVGAARFGLEAAVQAGSVEHGDPPCEQGAQPAARS